MLATCVSYWGTIRTSIIQWGAASYTHIYIVKYIRPAWPPPDALISVFISSSRGIRCRTGSMGVSSIEHGVVQRE
jgi:hypothetical protein